MSTDVRWVVLGGSGSSTPELADAIAAWPSGLERRPALEIVLVGRSRDKLEVVAAEFRIRAGSAGAPLSVTVETDRRRALEGADVVLNQVRVGGLDARVFDETFPRAFGLPGEETMGPGGLANALRTVPGLAATWDDVAAVAPRALVVNLTNPAGIVHQVLAAGWPGLEVATVCDAPEAFARKVADRLARPVDRVVARYVGLNHCGFYVPEDPAELRELADLGPGIEAEVVEAIGALPTPYLRYYLDPAAQLEAQRRHAPRAEELKSIDAALLAAYAAGPAAERRKRGAVWYDLVVVPLVDGWINGSARSLVVGTRNGERIAGVPAGAMIEVAHRLAVGRLEPLPAPARPPLVDLWLARHGTYEALAARAVARDAPRPASLRAMLANPMVSSAGQARRLLDAIEAGSPPTGGHRP